VKQTTPTLFLVPSALTDSRIYDPITEKLLNIYPISFEEMEQAETLERSSIQQYANAFTASLSQHPEFDSTGSKPIWLGGFCMGGMVSLLAVAEIRKRFPQANIQGVLLLSSCLSFKPALGRVFQLPKYIFTRLLGRQAAVRLTSAYLGKRPHTVLGRTLTLLKNVRRKMLAGPTAGTGFERLYSGMLADKDPEAVYDRLICEFEFDGTGTIIKEKKVFPAILHLHGDRDLFFPYKRVDLFRKLFVASTHITYELEKIEGASHFLPITHADQVCEFIKRKSQQLGDAINVV